MLRDLKGQNWLKKLLQCLFAFLVVAQAVSPAVAESKNADGENRFAWRGAARGIAINDTTPKGPYVLTLDDLKDVGICLLQIKYQAIFAYLEATRKELQADMPPQLLAPDAVAVVPVSTDDKFLPCRRDWLVFFIGTMEPVIHLMDHDVQECQKGEYQLEIPKADKQQVDILWQEWASGVKDLNAALDRVNDLLNDGATNNKAIADQTVAIYNTEKKLEDIRETVHHLVQDSLKQ